MTVIQELHVLNHAGKSYVSGSVPRYGNSLGGPGYGWIMHINGKPFSDYPVAIGDPNYREIKGAVKTMERHKDPRRVIVHYVARPEFEASIKAPLSVAEYDAMDSDRAKIIYKPVYREDPVPPEPAEFKTFDVDCKPVVFPEGVKVLVPEYLSRYKNTWHVLPCSMDPKIVLTKLALAVKEEAKGVPHIKIGEYLNLGQLTADADVEVKGFGGKLSLSLFKWKLADCRYDGTLVPKIRGDNLTDLLAKVDAFIAEQVKKLADIHRPTHCPCCAQKLPKNTKIVQPGRR